MDKACLMTESSPIFKSISKHCIFAKGREILPYGEMLNTTQQYYEAVVVSQRT